MDLKDITPLIDRLDLQLDDVEDALEPLLETLAERTATLPLLDKAKLYVNVAYALETLLFCSLKLNGTDPKNHPVFRELVRVRQYFAKIKQLEEPKEERPDNRAVDTQAAIRFIRSGLDDNTQVASKLKEQLAKEKAKAAIKKARDEQNKKAATALTSKNADKKTKKPSADGTSEEVTESDKSGRAKAKKDKRYRVSKKKAKGKP